jgi:hypothetical protein
VLRWLGVVLLAVAAVACSGSGAGDKTITVGSDQVPVARLVDAHAGLCEAAAHLDQARALFFDRSHESLHTVARALEAVDRAQAASLLQAKEKVESELTNPPPTLRDDLLRLADVYRTGLGRLAITAPPCDK